MKINKNICALSPFHLTGIGAIQISIIILLFDIKFAVIPLLIFILLCAIAPFLAGFSFYLPVISRGSSDRRAVALTFDDGPDPHITPTVLKMLSEYSVKATFFVTGKNASKYPDIIKDILMQDHSIGNHSYNHDPLLMFRTQSRLYKEINNTQDYLKEFGITPYAFRPPAGITNPRLRRVLLELGLYCVNFSCRAFDAGNKKINSLADKILRKVKTGDIILLHDKSPDSRNDSKILINEFKKILSGLQEKGLSIIPLSDLIGKEIMGTIPIRNVNPAQSFYNQYALSYDNDQFNSNVKIARVREYKIVSSRLPEIIRTSDRVLEIGAGTGIYTIPIAKISDKVIAVDIAYNMLKILKAKASSENLKNIHLILADMENFDINEKFNVICSFSSFEYIKDLTPLVKLLSKKLKPGGILYFTTSNKSFFRFFSQIGNAIIQGVWLHSRNKREILKILGEAELKKIKISTYLFKTIISRGMLLEVIARKSE